MGNNFKRQRVHRFSEDSLAKWPSGILAEGFVAIPKRLIRTLGEAFGGGDWADELSALLAVVDFKREGNIRLPSVSYLAYLAGLSEDVFLSSLDRMSDRGIISYKLEDNDLDDDDDSFCVVNYSKLILRVEETIINEEGTVDGDK